MVTKLKPGLIAGGALAALNLCGTGFLGLWGVVCAGVFGLAAAAAGGYLSAQRETPEKRLQTGASAGALTALLGLAGLLIGPLLGAALGAAFTTGASLIGGEGDVSTSLFGGALSGILGIPITAVILGLNLCVGMGLVAVSAGVGALAGAVSRSQA